MLFFKPLEFLAYFSGLQTFLDRAHEKLELSLPFTAGAVQAQYLCNAK